MATQFNNFYLASGGSLALSFGTSATRVYGSVDADTVTIAAGVTVVLDGSFNRGNDTIKFLGDAASYTIVRVNASTVRVTDLAGTSVTIPVGSAGTKIEFADATRTLSGSSAGIILGNQSVTATPLALAAGTAPPAVENYVLTTNAPTVSEGNAGTKVLTFVLSLDKAPTSAVTVNYLTTDRGTAEAGDDFQAAAGFVTFAPNQQNATVSITVNGDTEVEFNETVVLSLSGSKLVASTEAIGTIRNDDASAPVPAFELLPNQADVNEGGTATFRLVTTNVVPGSVLNYALSGISSSDVVGGQLTGVATVGIDGVALISVNLAADATTEGLETLSISVAGKTSSVVVNDTSKAAVITEAAYALTGSTNVNEGSIATVSLKTTGIPAGSLVGYRIVGTGSAASISQTGTFTVDADGNAVVSVAVGTNNTIGDTGQLTVDLLNGKSTPVVATVVDTTPTTYAADAITAANSASGVMTINVAGTAAQSITLDTDQLAPTNGFVINSASASVNVTSSGGADKITLTGNGNNTVNTGNQNDTVLISGSGNNTVVTGAGADIVTITGTGSNRIEVGSGGDKVTGGAGNDTIVVGSGDMLADDRFDGGDGIDTLIISGDGNVVDGTNVKNIENLVLNGTTVTIANVATLAKLQSIQGSATTSAVTVDVAAGDIIDLTGISLTSIKSIALNGGAGSVTLKADAADLKAMGAILKTGAVTVNLETNVEGYKALSAADTGITTTTVTGTAQELIDNKAILANATTRKVFGAVSLTDALALSDAGITAERTVTMSAADLLATLNYPDQVAALRKAGVTIQVTGVATAEQASKLVATNANGGFGEQIASYNAATGVPGIAIEDTPANVAQYLTVSGAVLAATGANAPEVASIKFLSAPGVLVIAADKLALLASAKVSGSYAVTDSVTNVVGAINNGVLSAALTKASTVSLTSTGRTASNAADALELQVLGDKLAGGYDVNLTVAGVDADVLSAVGLATAAKVTRDIEITGATIATTNNVSTVTVTSAAGLTVGAVIRSTKIDSGTVIAAINGNVLTLSKAALTTGATTVAIFNPFSIPEFDQLFAKNPSVVVHSVADTAQTLALNASKLANVSDAIVVTTPASVQQAGEIRGAIATLAAKDGATIVPGSGTNSYKISDNKSAVLADNNASIIKGSDGVTITGGALSLDEAVKLNGLVSASATDRLDGTDTLVYSVSEDAKVLATALSATDSTKANAALAGATGTVAATGTANLTEALVLKGNANVDSYKISDTVTKLFANSSADLTTAKAKASGLSVIGALTVDQMDALQNVETGLSGNAKIFDNVYAIKDTANALATKAAVGAADVAELTAASAITVDGTAAVADLAGLRTLNTALTTANKPGLSFSLTGAIGDIIGSDALGSGTSAVVTFVKTASSITVTADVTTATLTNLDSLAQKAGTKPYAVEITGAAGATAGSSTELADLATSVVTNAAVTKFIVSGTPTIDAVKQTIAQIGTAAAAKLQYSLTDSISALLTTANADVVRNAVNLAITSNTAITAKQAADLVALTGASGTVSYKIADSYDNLVLQAASIADGATVVSVSDASLSVEKYTNLLSLARPATGDSTTVTGVALVDSAQAVSNASAAVLGNTSGVTLTDNGSLTLSVSQALALANSTNDGYDVAIATSQPGDAAVQVRIVDTATNLIAAKVANTSSGNYVLGDGAYKVETSGPPETLTRVKADQLLSIADLTATFNIQDAPSALVTAITASAFNAGTKTLTLVTAPAGLAIGDVVSGFGVPAGTTVTNVAGAVITLSNAPSSFAGTGYLVDNSVTKAAQVTVKEVLGASPDAISAEEAKAILTANANATFDVVRTSADTIKAAPNNVYDYAATLAKAGKVIMATADSVADVKAALGAAGTTPVEYSLSDVPSVLAASANQSLVASAQTLAISEAAKAAEAAVLTNYLAKFASGNFAVTDTAGALVTNIAAVKAAGGTVNVDGSASVGNFQTLKGDLGAKLTTTNISDTAAAIADFRIAEATDGAGTYTFTGSKVVNAAQAANLDGQSVTGLIVVDTAAKLLTLSTDSQVNVYRANDTTVDLATAKLLYAAFTTKAEFRVATTSERFVKAFDSDAVTSGAQADAGAVNALKAAATVTVDGQTITFGAKNAALTAGRTTYNGNITGTVAELANIPASIKAAAGYVVVDSVANLSNPANASVVAGSVGYVVRDAAGTLANASASLLNSTQKALGIEVDGEASAEQITSIINLTNVDNFVVYSLKDVASALVTGTTLNDFGGVRKGITVDGSASAAQAKVLLTEKTDTHPVAVDVVTTAAGIEALDVSATFATNAAHLLGARSITIDSNAATAGLQGAVTAAQAATLRLQSSSVSMNIDDTAQSLATAIANTGAGANLATLLAAQSLSVTSGVNGTAADAAQAKQLAKVTIAGGYAVSDTAGALTTPATVAASDLAKATVVKVGTGTATVEQATTLTNLVNFERGTGTTDAGKSVLSIADTALNFAKFGSASLFSGLTSTSTVVVSANGYDTALNAAQAKALADLDAASGDKFDAALGSVKVKDQSSALLTTANAATLSKVASIAVDDVVSIVTLNQIRALNDIPLSNTNQSYTYKLQDGLGALIGAGAATLDLATSVRVSGTISVSDMAIVETRAAGASGIATTTTYERVSGTAAELFNGAGGTLNGTVAAYAESIDLVGPATLAQVSVLLADKQFNGAYDVGDTVDSIIAAINQVDSLNVLKAATSVGLSSGTATAEQAKMINFNLTNEAKLAIADVAAILNLDGYAATVAAAASVQVNAGTGNDGLAAGITAAKINYDFDGLDEMVLSGIGLDVINGKAGDVIDLAGIEDWNVTTSGTQGGLVLGTSVASLLAGENGGQYFAERGFFSIVDGTFEVSASGTDTRLSIGTDTTAGADQVIFIVGVTSITANAVAGQNVDSFTFG